MHPIELRFIGHDDVPLVIDRARTGRPALRLAGFPPLQRLQVCIREDVERDAAAALLEGGAQHLKEDGEFLEAASPLGDLFHICHAHATQVKPLVGHTLGSVVLGSQCASKFPDHRSPLGCTSSSCTASAAALVDRVSSYSFPCRNREVVPMPGRPDGCRRSAARAGDVKPADRKPERLTIVPREP